MKTKLKTRHILLIVCLAVSIGSIAAAASQGQVETRSPNIKSAEPIRAAPEDYRLRVIGTAVSAVPGKSLSVIVNTSTGMARICREGGEAYGVRVKQVFREAVILETDSGNVLLSAVGSGRGSFSGPAAEIANLPRQEIVTALPEYMALVRSISIRPYLTNGRPGGVLVYNIDPGSVFGRMGFVDGDVIQSINGQPLAATTDMKRFYEGIKTAGTVSLVIRRGQSLEALQFKVQ